MTPMTEQEMHKKYPNLVVVVLEESLLQGVHGLPENGRYLNVDLDCDFYCSCGSDDRDTYLVGEMCDQEICLGCGRKIDEDEDDGWYFSGNDEEFGAYDSPEEALEGIKRVKKSQREYYGKVMDQFTAPYQGKGNWS